MNGVDIGPNFYDTSWTFSADSNPNLTTISFQGIQGIASVSITNNPIFETLEMPGSQEIQTLYLYNLSAFTSLDLESVTTVESLELIDLGSLSSVNTPLLSDVGITQDLQFVSSSSLVVKGTNLTTWPFPGLTRLGVTFFTVRLNPYLTNVDLGALQDFYLINANTPGNFISFRQNHSLQSITVANATVNVC